MPLLCTSSSMAFFPWLVFRDFLPSGLPCRVLLVVKSNCYDYLPTARLLSEDTVAYMRLPAVLFGPSFDVEMFYCFFGEIMVSSTNALVLLWREQWWYLKISWIVGMDCWWWEKSDVDAWWAPLVGGMGARGDGKGPKVCTRGRQTAFVGRW